MNQLRMSSKKSGRLGCWYRFQYLFLKSKVTNSKYMPTKCIHTSDLQLYKSHATTSAHKHVNLFTDPAKPWQTAATCAQSSAASTQSMAYVYPCCLLVTCRCMSWNGAKHMIIYGRIYGLITWNMMKHVFLGLLTTFQKLQESGIGSLWRLFLSGWICDLWSFAHPM